MEIEGSHSLVTGGLIVSDDVSHAPSAEPREQIREADQIPTIGSPARLVGSQSIRINENEYKEFSTRGDLPPSFLVQHILTSMQKSKDRFHDCTRLFLSLQSKSILWHLIEDLNDELAREGALSRDEQRNLLERYRGNVPPENEMQRRAKTLLDFLHDRMADDSGFFFHPSPAGDMPLHLFFLLRVSDICQDVIREVYIGKSFPGPEGGPDMECINIAFKSNLRWLATDESVMLSSSFVMRMPSLSRAPSGPTTLRQFVGFDQTLKDWESKGWTVDGKHDDMGLYTGLTVLHIAIANQHIDEVAMLLQTAAADLHAKASGTFFQPPLVTPFSNGERLRFSAIRKQLVLTWLFKGKSMLKNERSGFYAGELPLSFAASVGNVDIMRILVDYLPTQDAKMALIAAADSFGNTALHMAVYHNRMEAFDWLMAHGGRQCMMALNLMGLTPFTVAAYTGNASLMLHILRVHMARPLWEFGDMRSVEIAMAQLDSFRISKLEPTTERRASDEPAPGGPTSLSTKYREWSYGRQHGQTAVHNAAREESLEEVVDLHASPCWRSAIEIIVTHQVENMTSIDNPESLQLIRHVINEKWRRFARKRHIKHRTIPFLVLVLFFSFLFVWRCSVLRQERNEEEGFPVADWLESRRRAVWGLEGAFVAISVPWLLYSGYSYLKLELSALDVNMDGEFVVDEVIIFMYKNMQSAGDFAAVTCMFICGMCRIAGADKVEIVFYTFLIVVLWANIMSLLTPSRTFGSLTFMIYRMLVGDIFKFLVIYLLLLLGFGMALFGLLQKGDFPRDKEAQSDLECLDCDVYLGTVVQKLIWVSMGEVEQSGLLAHMEMPALGTALYILYAVLSLLLLLNLIIAMMGDTYLKASQDTERDWFWPYACLVLQYENEMRQSKRQRHRLGLSSETESEQGQGTFAPFVYYRETTTTGDEKPHILL